MAPSDPSLLRALQHQLSAHSDAPALWLGLSGGLDSMLLLDLLAELTSTSTCPPLRAIHVHHGLHPLADQWAALCVRACARYGVPLQVERVVLARQASIEEAARDALAMPSMSVCSGQAICCCWLSMPMINWRP